jgi:hypothetical protein
METTSLTNFNVPLPLRNRFDAICHASGRTRTSVLVGLMTDYILNQSQLLATRNHQFQLVDELLGENSFSRGGRSFPNNPTRSSRSATQTGPNKEFDLPEFLVCDGQEGW